MTLPELIELARKRIDDDWGGKRKFYTAHGVARESLAGFLRGERTPTLALCKALGVRPVTTYEPIGDPLDKNCPRCDTWLLGWRTHCINCGEKQ